MTKLNKVLVTFIIGIFSVTANASLIFTSDQIAFNDAIVVGASDDFESLGLGPGGILGLGNNVNRSDFTYSAPTGVVGLGSGIGGLTSVGLASDRFVEALTIDISGGHNIFGFEYTSTDSGTLNISIFDTLDNLIGFTTVATTSTMSFIGMMSDIAIGRVLLDDGGIPGPIIDNVVAGATLVPEPSILALLTIGLIGLASVRFKKKS